MIRILSVAMIFAVVIGCSQTSSEPTASRPEELTATSFNLENAPIVEFSVPDMMCPQGCGVAVKDILAKQPGAKDVLVDFEGKTAKVAIDERQFDPDKALAALIDRQFTNSALKSAAVTTSPPAEAAPVQ